MTLILVTHDAGIAQRASRTIEMRDGRIVYDGAAAEHRPRRT
jgi:predicted ABC-type transport system involved in lysophospholipase L1 biosynthesis ATPase subunit